MSVLEVLRVDLPSRHMGTLPAASDRDAFQAERGDCVADSSTDIGCFVAGPENRVPIAALEDLLLGAGDCSCRYCPLVLVGPSGTGKSLLCRSIVRRWRPVLGDLGVAYYSAVDFAREWSDTRADGHLAEFQGRLAQLQLIVLEDLHRLPSRATIQCALRRLIDQFRAREGTVLCTSQLTPAGLRHWDAGLRDRLSSGLLLWLHHPGSEARLELLRLAAAERTLRIDDRQLRVLAETARGCPQQVLRALHDWELSCELKGFCSGRHATIAAKDVIAVVSRYFGVTQAALRGPTRRKTLVLARGAVVHLLRSLTNMSYAEIGHALGNRDHTTIMHANSSLDRKLREDNSLRQSMEELRRILISV